MSSLYQFLTGIGLKPESMLGGLVGAIISLKFVPGNSYTAKIFYVIGGLFTAAYLSPFMVAGFNLSPRLEAGCSFLVGLYGMIVISAFVDQIPILVKKVSNKLPL